MSNESPSRKRKRKNQEEDKEKSFSIEILPQPAKKRKVDRVQELKFVYIVMTEKGDEGTGSDYQFDNNLPEHYDTEIIGVYSSRTKANKAAQNYFNKTEDEVMETLDIIDDTQNGLFFKTRSGQNDECTRFGGTFVDTRVWVEQKQVIY